MHELCFEVPVVDFLCLRQGELHTETYRACLSRYSGRANTYFFSTHGDGEAYFMANANTFNM